ncbi:uncharacterized protein LOC115734609 isoform X1 [Rhodamnia argentea]|uniref:Uncharacterized protein LOC115734609 isoform X1 n=2 Tax=Rhodamnia argentea TaxID=178133 RepID=A0A8B8NFS1_9MYRT|nr:uncharacterized protein LOC115734609 isoform X1 [Rhodamnia argentea]
MAFSRGCSQRNLQCFLDSVTPIVPSRTASRSHIHDINHLWQPAGKEMIEYFELHDLWHSYEEWSAFGVSTKVVLSNGQTVKQYYVPYLSAIQIYTNRSIVSTRTKAEGNVAVEFESDSWSDDSGSDKLSRSLSNNSSKTWDSISEDSSSDQPVSWPMRDNGSIYLEYFEACSPNWRIPLSNKITELTKDHQALTTLRSMDISPASWMAVAWYPIYHIPSSSNNKDLLTCFLTYHTLSSSFLDCTDDFYEDDECHPLYMDSKLKGVGSDQIPISPFGLATYKMRGDLWAKPGTYEHLKFTHLHNAAHSWVKQLNIYHHDLNFFSRDSIV